MKKEIKKLQKRIKKNPKFDPKLYSFEDVIKLAAHQGDFVVVVEK